MFQIGICDDDALFGEKLRRNLEAVIKKLKMDCNISVWHKESELMEYLKQKKAVDLLFLDIELVESSGIDLGKFIREDLLNVQIQRVYVSHEEGYAMQLFETEPMDFLVKPVKQEKLVQIMQRFIRQQSGLGKLFVYKDGHGKAQIPYASVWYFQSMNHKVAIHTMEGQKEFYGKLAEVESAAPDYFVRIHKSYLVNEYFIESYHYDKVVLRGGQKLAISKSYRNAVQERISKQEEL